MTRFPCLVLTSNSGYFPETPTKLLDTRSFHGINFNGDLPNVYSFCLESAPTELIDVEIAWGR